MSLKNIIKKCKRGGVTPSSEQISSDFGAEQSTNSSPQRGGEFADGRRETSSSDSFVFPRPLWERARVRGEINSYTEEQHLQSAECWLKTQAVCRTFQPNEDTFNANVVIDNEESQNRGNFTNHAIFRVVQDDENSSHSRHTERERKYPVTNSKELSCKNSNYIETNNQLDCFGSKEPHNDDTNSLAPCGRADLRTDGVKRVRIASRLRTLLRSNMYETLRAWSKFKTGQGEGSKVVFTVPSRGLSDVKDILKTDTNNAILRGLNNYSPQNDSKNSCRLMRGDVCKTTRKVAFTLAEVLITLGIISVVATITLSVFISRYQEKVLLNQLQTANNILGNATTKLLQDEGETIKQFGNTPAERFIKYQDKLQNNLKIIKVCERLPFDNNDCNPYKISRYDPSQDKYVIDNYHVVTRLKTFVLANGMKIFFNAIESESGSDYLQCNMKTNFVYDNEYSYPENRKNGTYSSSCGSMYVDINGNKGPNAINKDIFLFYIVQDGIIPAGMQQEGVWTQTFEDGCRKGGRDVYSINKCTAWALINKNMDYLRCSDLSWTGKKSCKE